MEKELSKLSIADPKASTPAVTFADKKKGVTGAYLLTVKPGTKVYHYDVDIKRTTYNASKVKVEKVMTKRGSDE